MAKALKKIGRSAGTSSGPRMKAKGFEHIKILKPAVEPSKARATRIRAAVRAYYREQAAAT